MLCFVITAVAHLILTVTALCGGFTVLISKQGDLVVKRFAPSSETSILGNVGSVGDAGTPAHLLRPQARRPPSVSAVALGPLRAGEALEKAFPWLLWRPGVERRPSWLPGGMRWGQPREKCH